MRILLWVVFVAVLAVATPIGVAFTGIARSAEVTESWEGAYTVLGMQGTGSPPLIAEIRAGTPIDPIHGTQLLELVNNSATGAPQAYVAWIKNLAPGDVVDVCLGRYDGSDDGSTPCRLWAHWNGSIVDLDFDTGDAGGNSDPSAGTGWEQTCHTWTVPQVPVNYMGLVIEVVLDVAYGDTVFVDAMTITAPDHAAVLTMPSQVPVERCSWSAIKALYE